MFLKVDEKFLLNDVKRVVSWPHGETSEVCLKMAKVNFGILP